MQVLKVTATGLARTGKTYVSGVVIAAGVDAATAVLNDSLDGTGGDKGAVNAVATASDNNNMYGCEFETGVYVTLTGTSPIAYVYFQ